MISRPRVASILKIILSHFISGSISHFEAQFPPPSSTRASFILPALPSPSHPLFNIHPPHRSQALPPSLVSFFLSLRAFSWWSAGPDPGPLEVQLPGEPPDGRVGSQAESRPSPGALSPPAAACGAGAGMQPEFPHRHRQVLRRTLRGW